MTPIFVSSYAVTVAATLVSCLQADLLHLPTSILYNTHMCEEEEEVVDPMQPGAARIRTWDAMAALSEVHAAADEQFLLAGRITKLEPYGDNALEVQVGCGVMSCACNYVTTCLLLFVKTGVTQICTEFEA